MLISSKRLILTSVLVLGLCGMPAFAQKYELYPYAGGQFQTEYTPDNSENTFNLKNPGIFGLKFGVFVSGNFEIEGNGAYINQFNFRDYSYRTKAYLYEAAGTYNFGARHFGHTGFYPYATFGIGGTSLDTEDFQNTLGTHNDAVYNYRFTTPDTSTSALFPRTSGAVILQDGDTFFNFSYGGGVKLQRLWGPLGLRFDLRGRTMPNFFGKAINAFEPTGGLLVSWGER